MKKKYPNHLLIKDIGSGLNMKRKGLNKLIDLAISGKVNEIVVAHKDRLSRFGYDMIERIIKKYSDGEIKIIGNEKIKEKKEELVDDVMEVMNVFVAKINGMRKYQ